MAILPFRNRVISVHMVLNFSVYIYIVYICICINTFHVMLPSVFFFSLVPGTINSASFKQSFEDFAKSTLDAQL